MNSSMKLDIRCRRGSRGGLDARLFRGVRPRAPLSGTDRRWTLSGRISSHDPDDAIRAAPQAAVSSDGSREWSFRLLFPSRGAQIDPEGIPMADARLVQARQYHAADDYAGAERLCRQVLADDPQAAEAWRLLG